MRYWVFINNEVLPQMYEGAALAAIPGINDDTMLMPENSQDWAPANSFEEVQNLLHPPTEPAPAPEDYNELTDRSAIPAHYLDAPTGDLNEGARSSSLEETLLLRIEDLAQEIRSLRLDVQAININKTQPLFTPQHFAPMPEQEDEPVPHQQTQLRTLPVLAPEPQPEPKAEEVEEVDSAQLAAATAAALHNPVKMEEIADLDEISAQPDSFLQDAVAADISGRQAALNPDTEIDEKEASLVDLSASIIAPQDAAEAEEVFKEQPTEVEPIEEPVTEEPAVEPQPEPATQEPAVEPEAAQEPEADPEPQTITLAHHAAAPEQEPAPQPQEAAPAKEETPAEEEIEDVKEDPLPPAEELQAQELQAEPYAGEPSLGESAAKAAAEQQKTEEEYIPQPVMSEEQLKAVEEADALQSTAISEAIDAPITAAALEAPEAEPVVEPVEPAPAQTQEGDNSPNFEVLEAPKQEEKLESLDDINASAPATSPAQLADDDKFVKTVATGIEEVFLDQPTSIISDYVPPTIVGAAMASAAAAAQTQSAAQPEQTAPDAAPATAQQAAPQSAPAAQEPQLDDPTLLDLAAMRAPATDPHNPPTIQTVRRIKPAAIKTVPMVSGDGADVKDLDLGFGPQVEEASIPADAQGGEPSAFFKFVKMFSGLVVLLVILLTFVMLLAWMSIIPKAWSPLHSLLSKANGTPAASQVADPPVVTQPDPAQAEAQRQAEESARVLESVKNFTLPEGVTLAAKVEAQHAAVASQIIWTADLSPEPDYYSIAVILPPNPQGYTLTYRFTYNVLTGALMPTTSEAHILFTQPLAVAEAAQGATNE